MGCEAQKDVGGQYKHGLCGSTAETGECSTREHQGTISCTFRGLNVITLMGWINLIFFSKMIIGHNWPLFFGDFLLHIFWHFDTWLHRAIFYLMGLKILLAPYVISCQNFSCGARRIFISIERTENSLFFVFLLPQKVYLTEDICFCVFFHIFHLLSFLTCLTLPFEINEFQQLRLCQFQWPNFLCVILVDIHNGTRCIDMKILFSPLDSLVPKGFSNLKWFFLRKTRVLTNFLAKIAQVSPANHVPSVIWTAQFEDEFPRFWTQPKVKSAVSTPKILLFSSTLCKNVYLRKLVLELSYSDHTHFGTCICYGSFTLPEMDSDSDSCQK